MAPEPSEDEGSCPANRAGSIAGTVGPTNGGRDEGDEGEGPQGRIRALGGECAPNATGDALGVGRLASRRKHGQARPSYWAGRSPGVRRGSAVDSSATPRPVPATCPS